LFVNSGVFNLSGSTVTQNTATNGSAGGIGTNVGVVGSVVGSTISNNTAGTGGGVYLRGELSIDNSTFSGNRALGSLGGGIRVSGSTYPLHIQNSTFIGNVANENGNILYGGGTNVDIVNSIFQGNSSKNCSGVHKSLGHNVSNTQECGLVGATDILGYALSDGLQNNGGLTKTHALQEGSIAIDSADAVYCPATDQRGVVRPQGDGCDIGAYEYEIVNQPPLSNAGEDQVGDEGDVVTLDGSGSSDADGVEDIVSYEWDFGDGGTGSRVTVEHVYADDGVYAATLTVTDAAGESSSDTVQVTVGNEAPTIVLASEIQVFPTETTSVSGSFTDPGADTWTVSVDYGDGTGIQTLSVDDGNAFVLVHSYAIPGVHTVTVEVLDDDGGSDTEAVEVATNSVDLPAGQDVTVTLDGVTLTFNEVTSGGIATIQVT
jgi:hypothetical protein